MANVQKSTDIAAPMQRVWELATDLERLGDWVSIHRNFPEPPAGKVGEAAGRVLSGHAEREADASLSRLKQLVEG